MTAEKYLEKLYKRVNDTEHPDVRFKNWTRIIKWQIGDEEYFWSTDENGFSKTEASEADIIFKCSTETIKKLANKELPLFIAIWATGDIEFEGPFGDAFRLGYVFLNDNRRKKVVFLSHCFLNTNTRFPGGCAYEGATTPLIQTILESGVGIIQMPCPEYECLGLEKYKYGQIVGDELRKCFNILAGKVVQQVQDYLEFGFDIKGIMGMNPSPSCGVEITKGKGTMLGTDRDTSEKEGCGLFIEEIISLLDEKGIKEVPVFGVRRILPGEEGIDKRLKLIKAKLD